jgi:hypothetical protein
MSFQEILQCWLYRNDFRMARPRDVGAWRLIIWCPPNWYIFETFFGVGKGWRNFLRASWPLKMGPTGCPETSVQNYYSILRNIPEERRPYLHHGESLKSRKSTSVPIQAIKIYRRNEGAASLILNLGTKLRWLVSLTPRQIYPLWKNTPVPIKLEAGWIPDATWTFWRRDKSLAHAGIRTQSSSP